jgi:hypothetical protein
LFDPARPLLERFGAAFFKAVPPRPGVYIMGGDAERVLYIGQSSNLRQRLASYKNARPDRAPRKVIRLIHAVRTLVWEECESAEAARLKEAQLLRVHRPKFNVQNTYPRAYQFISLNRTGGQWEFSLGPEPKPEGSVYGAFKTGVRIAYSALLRLVWAALHQPGSPHEFPAPLLRVRPPREFRMRPTPNIASPGLDQLMRGVESLLGGQSAELIDHLAIVLPTGSEITAFQRNLMTADLEILRDFYERGAKRNRDLRAQHHLAEPIIPQEKLDDLLAMTQPAARRRNDSVQPRMDTNENGDGAFLDEGPHSPRSEAGDAPLTIPKQALK